MKHSDSLNCRGILLATTFAVMLLSLGCSDNGNEDGRWQLPTPVNQTEIDIDPAWSPDGSKLIYFRHYASAENHYDTQWVWGVFLHDVPLGTDSLLWANFEAYGFDWSLNGERIAFSWNAQIYISDLSRQNIQHIESHERSHDPQWSPCGDRLLYFIRLGNTSGMYTYYWSTNSSHLTVPYASGGSWMNGCENVAIIDYADGDSSDLSIYSIKARTRLRLPKIDRFKRGIAASPDGNTILIARDGYGAYTNIWKFDVESWQYTQLTKEGGNSPDWSPDGQWIVFTKVDKDNGYLWLMRPDGSNKHQITF